MGGTWTNFGAGLVLLAGLTLCAPAVAAENSIRMPVDKSAAPDPLGEMVKSKKAAAEKKAEEEAQGEQKGQSDQKAQSEKKGAFKKLEPDGVARGEAKKSEPAKPEQAKPEQAKADEKKPEAKKPEAKKSEAKKPEVKKPEASKADEKKTEAKKADQPQTEAPKPAAKVAEKKAPEPKPAPAKLAPATPASAKPAVKPAANKAEAPKPADNATAPAPAAAVAPAPKPEPKPVPKPAPKPVVDPVAFVMPAGPAGGAPAHEELPASGLYVGNASIEFQHTQIILRAATTKEVERVTWFYLKEPRRLALDLRGGWHKKGMGTLRYDTGPVKHIVTGEHPDRLRLVLEFREGAVPPGFDPVVVREPGGGVTVTIPLAR